MKDLRKTIILCCAIMALALCSCSTNAQTEPSSESTGGAEKSAEGVPASCLKELFYAAASVRESAMEEIEERVAEYEEQQKEAAVPTGSTAYGIPEPLDTLTSDNGDLLVRVNKQHAVSADYVPTDMVPVDGSLSTNQGLYFKREAYDAYLRMLEDAKNEGINFMICSTYRSYDTQVSIYHNYVATYGAERANLRSAYPGRSEHHTGWAVDVTSKSMNYGLSQDFINYPEGQWINDHCSEYGFIVRYLKDKTDITGYAYEPWHLRYVGVEAAQEIMSQGLTLEEYLGKA